MNPVHNFHHAGRKLKVHSFAWIWVEVWKYTAFASHILLGNMELFGANV